MGLYNPQDAQDVPSHVLSHTFRYATSLSIAQLQMVDALSAAVVSCHNMMVKDIKHLKEDGAELLTHLQREVMHIGFSVLS
jgi:hypothetical protein